tara:strand:+ start:197 stop:343 length:147 start_codon:yes stop_codon:yes gene_type:complete
VFKLLKAEERVLQFRGWIMPELNGIGLLLTVIELFVNVNGKVNYSYSL